MPEPRRAGGLAGKLATWRRMGPARGTALATRLAARSLRVRVRRRRLSARALKVGPGELRRALGGIEPVDALRECALPALPTVERLEERLGGLDEEERAAVLSVADHVVAHRFDLLGSGPVELGAEIDWQLDFKSGRRWPLEHISLVPIVFPDGSDIKVPWELGRCQHLPVLAAAYRLTGDDRYVAELGAQLDSFVAANPVEFGAQWASAMDVAIRASNWVAALALCAEHAGAEPWLPRALESLLLHGRFIRSHLEWAESRGNHYLSNVVGLLPLAALFRRGAEGRRWADWATAELEAEMRHQVSADGCDHEASIPYHRLVCELLVCGGQAAERLRGQPLSEDFHRRLDAMLGFAADYTRPDGLAPQVGDADDGRFLPLLDYGRADQRSHLHLFEQAGRPPRAGAGHAAYPQGGFWVMRAGDLHAVVRCGDVGVGGVGPHAHNDQLSFELSAFGEALVVDPGTYIYTADPEARNLFRSTPFHSTLRIDGAEQNEIRPGALFELDDATRAECIGWSAEDHGKAVFEGRHHGYERLNDPALHERRLELDPVAGELRLRDTVESSGEHELEWTFPLAPGSGASAGEGEAVVEGGAARLSISAPGLSFAVVEGWYSPSYGVRVAVPFLRATKRGLAGSDVTDIVFGTRAGRPGH